MMIITVLIIQHCWPAHPDDPQGIRVASVFEFSECLFSVCSLIVCLSANFLICYSTVQYSTEPYL